MLWAVCCLSFSGFLRASEFMLTRLLTPAYILK